VDEHGVVSLEDLKNAIRQDTILVSMMMVNNEIGAIEPVQEAGKLIKSIDDKILFHVDAVQAYGKLVIRPRSMNIDLLSVSSHKIHGPKGVGFLYIKKGTKINPICYGGGQQKGMRSGTENVPGIAGMALAAKMCYEDFDSKIEKLYELKKYLIESLNKRIADIKINGPEPDKGAPHIVSVSIRGLRAETILNMLSSKQIYVSAGSACTSNNPHISDTLQAIGLERDLLESTIRVSMSLETTKEEIDYLLDTLEDQVETMRKFYRR
jgi:cysteine desulfurase